MNKFINFRYCNTQLQNIAILYLEYQNIATYILLVLSVLAFNHILILHYPFEDN